MALATIVAAVIVVVGGQIPGLAAATTIGPFWFGYLGVPSGIAALTLGVTAILVLTPVAFVSGVAVWRLLPSTTAWFGPIAGISATTLAYLVGVLVSGGVLVAESVLADPASASTVSELLFGVVYVGLFVFFLPKLSLFCISVPVGALIGYVHEQAHTASELTD